MSVLTAIVEGRGKPMGIRELSRAADVPASSVHRYTKVMDELGLIVAGDGGYVAGPEFERLARLAVADAPVAFAAQSELDQLAKTTGETAVLAVFDHQRARVMFVAQSEGRHPLRYVLPLYEWISPLHGASGLAIVAFLSDTAVTELLTNEPTRDALQVELEGIQRRGFALSHGQRIPGAVGISSPVFSADGRVTGDISLTVPSSRFDAREQDRLVNAVRDAAARVSRALGAPPTRLAILTDDDPTR
jgi:DNA-binding IclR family transcriptional regulator